MNQNDYLKEWRRKNPDYRQNYLKTCRPSVKNRIETSQKNLYSFKTFGKKMKWMEDANSVLDDEVINGILLGDGYLGNLRKQENSYIQLLQSVEHKQLVFDFQQHLERLGFHTGLFEYSHIRHNNLCHNVKVYSYRGGIFTNLRKIWYPEGEKIIPKMLKLTPLTLAYWYMCDGTASYTSDERVTAMFCTQGFGDEEVLRLKKLLEDDLGFTNLWLRRAESNNGLMIHISKISEINKLMKMIEPFILDSFRYKIKYASGKSHDRRSKKTEQIVKSVLGVNPNC